MPLLTFFLVGLLDVDKILFKFYLYLNNVLYLLLLNIFAALMCINTKLNVKFNSFFYKVKTAYLNFKKVMSCDTLSEIFFARLNIFFLLPFLVSQNFVIKQFSI